MSLDAFTSDLRNRGIRFLDKADRARSIDQHVEQVAKDAVVDLTNSSTLMAARALGSPGVRVSDGLSGDSDKPCLDADGQAWTNAYAMANKKEHPNCVREFQPLPRTFDPGGFDK